MTLDPAILRTLVKPRNRDATDAELALFTATCERTGLDPLARQIYAQYRFNNTTKQEQMSIQATIDGFRTVAERSGDYLGGDAPQWCGQDSVWRDVWLQEDHPSAAKVTVRKLVDGTPGETTVVAHWKEYAPTGAAAQMWTKMSALMLAKCFSEDTQILTTRGFEFFGEVEGQLLQVTDSGLVPCDARPFVQPYTGPMITLDGDDLNFSVSPNHEMIVVEKSTGILKRVEAQEVFDRSRTRPVFCVPRSVNGTQGGIVASDALIRLAAIYVADGYDASNRIKIGVAKSRKIDALDDLALHLSRIDRGVPSPSISSDRRVVVPTLSRITFMYDSSLVSDIVGPGKVINMGNLLQMSRDQAKLFCDTLIEFDGHNGKFYSSRLDHIEAFEVSAVAAGYSVSRRYSRVSDLSKRPNYCVRVSDRDLIPVVRWGREYKGKGGNYRNRTGLVESVNRLRVWCVTVPSGVIVVRRNGFSMLCGNCAEALALRRAFPMVLSGLYSSEEMAQARLDEPSEVSVEPIGDVVSVPAVREGLKDAAKGLKWAAIRECYTVAGLTAPDDSSQAFANLDDVQASALDAALRNRRAQDLAGQPPVAEHPYDDSETKP